MDLSCQVMVYDSTASAYREMLEELPALFDSFGVRDQEYLTDDVLHQMEQRCRDTFFCGEMIPPYARQDIENRCGTMRNMMQPPPFYTFDDLDRNRLDVGQIAQHLWDLDLGPRKRKEYIDQLWEQSDDNLLRLFFGRKLYFIRELDIAISKLAIRSLCGRGITCVTVCENWKICRFMKLDRLIRIMKSSCEMEHLKRQRPNEVLTDAPCAAKRVPIGVISRLIISNPEIRAAKAYPKNLQILCPRCNGKKGDR